MNKNIGIILGVVGIVLVGGLFLVKGGTKKAPDVSNATETNAVSYADAGFSPSVIKVKVGTLVTFTNNSSESMWVATDPHPIHTNLPGFDQKTTVSKGGVFTFTFSKAGTMGYHNHQVPNHTGTVVVE